MKRAVSKNFDSPDEKRGFRGHGHLDVLNFGEDHLVGRGVFEPGWKWSVDVKPIAETKSCEAEHFGYCISGKMTIKMDSGEEVKIQAGDAFHLAPGHDAWVEGNEPCVLIDFGGFKEYAKPKEKKQAA